ncbi:MAG: formate dehydrogenase subunit delta [Rhodoferax sp.]|nr:formate dehydrogenase subunit delta [Rhodoferax sp.]NMM20870.1 formate dehydrogenase subunit delta [Rhodoferax sp.]
MNFVIASYFSVSAPALEGIATHLKKFWDPRMRQAFLAQVEGPHHQDISEIVLAAVHAHRTLIG